MRITTTIIGMLALLASSATRAEEAGGIINVPFDKLGELEVTSVSKQPENSFKSAAAIFVLTAEDIKRSGANSVPEALRFVPGVEVARVDSNRWAITARGFNREFANKLLVLVDGRSAYTPLFSGTYWDAQDMVLEDIERIEVIRGPGATLWGSNAVNGVINIITKDSKYTQDNYSSVGFGSFENNITEARHGGKIDDHTFYRMSAKYVDMGSTRLLSGADGYDDSEHAVANWRMDWSTEPHTNYTWLVNATSGLNGRNYTTPTPNPNVAITENYKGLNSLIRWEENKEDTNSQLQFYVDYATRDDNLLIDQQSVTLDLDWQHGVDVTDRLNMMWGLGYRYFKNDLDMHQYDGVTLIDYTPPETDNNLYSGFVQGKYILIPDTLNLTVGSKFEHNFYTDFEYQPSVRMSWTPTQKQTIWAAVSRAVRIPSQGERSISLVAAQVAPNLYLRAMGQDTVDAENLLSYEAGYRIEPYRWLTFDVASYYNIYDDLRSYEFNGGLNVPIANRMNSEVKGVEFSTRVMLDEDFMVQGSYTFMDMDVYGDPGSTDFISGQDSGASPRHAFNLLTRYNIQENLYFDANFARRSQLTKYGIDDYSRLDLTVTWRPIEKVEVSLSGQNLTDDYHAEFVGGTFGAPVEIPRSLFGKVAVKF